MRNSIQPQLIQNWTLLGMKPMHRALARRTVQSLVREANLSFSPSWHNSGLDALESVNNSAFLETMVRPGVMIIDRNSMIEKLSTRVSNDVFADQIKDRSTVQIRLLWSWVTKGILDLLWCTELCFDGVVHDIRSLEHWSRVCLHKAPVFEAPAYSILSGIQLPLLIKPQQSAPSS